MIRLARLSPLPFLLSSLAAQGLMDTFPTRGNLSGHEISFVLGDDNPSAVTPSEFVRKTAGIPGPLDTYVGTGTTTVPEFTAAAIQSWLNSLPGVAGVVLEIDAMSTGNDLAPIEPVSIGGTNVAVVDPNGVGDNELAWAGIYMTFERDVQDIAPAGGYWNGLNANEAGSEVVGYYFEGSTLPQQMIGQVFLEQSNVQGDFLDGTVNQSPTMNITALDGAIGHIIANRGAPQPGIVPSVDKLFFSVSAECAQALQGNGMLVKGLGRQAALPMTGATIFVAEYQSGVVSNVSVHLEYDQVAPPIGHPSNPNNTDPIEADLDALAVCNPSPMALPEHYVVSFAGDDFGEQLQVLWANPFVLLNLRTESGLTLFQVLMILGTTDVDSICFVDPESALGIPATFGTPIQDGVTAPRLGISLVCEDAIGPVGSPLVRLKTTVSGWAGPTTGTPGTVYLFLQPITSPPSLIEFVGAVPRTAADHVLSFEFDISEARVPVGQLTGFQVGFVPSNPSLPSSQSWPLVMRR